MGQQPFARIFEHENYGQIVLVSGTDDDNKPTITIFVKPAWCEVCSAALGYENEVARDHRFQHADITWAEKIATGIFELSVKACNIQSKSEEAAK